MTKSKTDVCPIEAATGKVASEKMFLKISQSPHDNICVGVFFLTKLQWWVLQFSQKKRL